MQQLGQVLREQDESDCVVAYEESLALSERIDDLGAVATTSLNLSNAYKDLPAIHNLDQAEHWSRRCLEVAPEQDRQKRAKCLGQIGFVAWERFMEARTAGKPETELLHHLNDAARIRRAVLAVRVVGWLSLAGLVAGAVLLLIHLTG